MILSSYFYDKDCTLVRSATDRWISVKFKMAAYAMRLIRLPDMHCDTSSRIWFLQQKNACMFVCFFFNWILLNKLETLNNKRRILLLAKYYCNKVYFEHQNNRPHSWPSSVIQWPKMATSRNEGHNNFPLMQQLSFL